MSQDQILEKLRAILKENVGLTRDVQLTTALVGERALDSMQFFNYLIWVEETFAISVPEEDVVKYELGVMGNMVNYLAEKKI
jgi:acyl carrier protein